MSETDASTPAPAERSTASDGAPSAAAAQGDPPELGAAAPAIDPPVTAPPTIDPPVTVAAPDPRVIPSTRGAQDPLRALRWLAFLGVAALVLGRFLGPALPGVTVGMGRAVRAIELLGGALTQLFAVGVIVSLVMSLITAVTTTIPPWMRLLAMAAGGIAALIVVGGAASTERVPAMSALPAALAAGAFAVLASRASRASRASPVARLPAVVLGAVGAAAVIRAVAGIALQAGSVEGPGPLLTFGRVAVTISAVLVALADLLALVYVSRRSPAAQADGSPPRSPLWSPATIAVLLLAVLCARQATSGASADAGALSVVLKRAADRFLVQPEPYLGRPVRLFLGFLTPFTAAALLFVRRVPTLTAALCLTLVAADVTDAPLGAITLVLASLGVLLVARSGHVLWSALVARPPAAPPT